MKVLHVSTKGTPHEISLEFGPAESRAVRAALGEVCSGFRVGNFEAIIGCSEDQARMLFDRLNGFDLDRQNTITIEKEELRVIKNAHAETLRTLGVEEYTTRTGVEIGEGRALLVQIEMILPQFPINRLTLPNPS